jgi:hypothetical protein
MPDLIYSCSLYSSESQAMGSHLSRIKSAFGFVVVCMCGVMLREKVTDPFSPGNEGFELVSVITFTNNAGAVMQRLYLKKRNKW